MLLHMKLNSATHFLRTLFGAVFPRFAVPLPSPRLWAPALAVRRDRGHDGDDILTVTDVQQQWHRLVDPVAVHLTIGEQSGVVRVVEVPYTRTTQFVNVAL